MTLLSSPLSSMRPRYDAVIIGSGYGGSITCSRLARSSKASGTPLSVCLLERGKEVPVGRFPDNPLDAAKEFQINASGKQIGDEDALYWLHKGNDISVFQGCGLGGTSLVNANVALRPESRVWNDPRWPSELLEDLHYGVAAGFEAAEVALGSNPYPGSPALKKFAALKKSAEHMRVSDQCYYPPLTVTFDDRVNAVGIHQAGCNGCGDCVSGCNTGSKNTLMMNYLPDAKNRGAEIFCSIRVQSVKRIEQGWRVYFQPAGCDRAKFDAPEMFVDADTVVLSAGALGSAEILLRSKRRGLSCSNAVGQHFSGNGDVLGFGYNNNIEINGMGMGAHAVSKDSPPGPCISGIIDRRTGNRYEDAHVIEEGVIPGAIAPLLPGAFAEIAKLEGTDTDDGVYDSLRERVAQLASAFPGGAYRGAMANTQTYLVMSHDDSGGQVVLEGANPTVRWPGVGNSKHFFEVNEQLLEATKATGGTYVPSPFFNKVFGYELVTVHPLGGCAMANGAGTGATNHLGQVFAATTGDDVYDSFYVSDGSILPCSVGVNPFLTISALAERNVRRMVKDHGWTVDEGKANKKPAFDGKPDARGIHLQFTEKMAGFCSTTAVADGQYAASEADGKAHDSSCEFVLTIATDDLDSMVRDPEHAAQIVGTVNAPNLSPDPMTVCGGIFNLFVQDPNDNSLKRMCYRMILRAESGERFFFDGYKLIKHDSGIDVWSDTTTLYVRIYRGESATGAVVAQGVLHIAESDFATQMTTMKAFDAEGNVAPQAIAKFGILFARSLWNTYGIRS